MVFSVTLGENRFSDKTFAKNISIKQNFGQKLLTIKHK